MVQKINRTIYANSPEPTIDAVIDELTETQEDVGRRVMSSDFQTMLESVDTRFGTVAEKLGDIADRLSEGYGANYATQGDIQNKLNNDSPNYLKNVSVNDHTFIFVKGDGSTKEITPNIGVTQIASGTENGTISVTANNTTSNIRIAGFDNVATNVSPALVGTPTAPTAATSNKSDQIATTQFVHNAIADLVSTAPSALDTLSELSSALNNDPNFATTVTNQIGQKLNANDAGYIKGLSVNGDTVTYTRGDNTTGTFTISAGIGAGSITTGSTNGTISVNSEDVPVKGLKSAAYMDASDFVTAEAQAADAAKLGGIAAASYATLNNPTFTGIPMAPTATTGNNSTQIATTAFVQGELANKADKATTLAGYGITDAYTKTETTSTINTAITNKADKATTLDGYGITNAYTKTEVDASLNGKLGSAETAADSNKLGGVAASEYALKSDIPTVDPTSGTITSLSWSEITSKPTSFPPSEHTQASNTINALTGYVKPANTGALATTDTLNGALGKLERTLDGLDNKADKATTLAGYGITDAYTKTETDTALAGKANTATTLAGYGITDAYTKTEMGTSLTGKADKATTLSGYGITDAYTKTEVDTSLSNKLGSSETAADANKLGGVAASEYALKSDIPTVDPTSGTITSLSWSEITSKPTSFPPSAHTQASNTIDALTGYIKPANTGALETTDTLNGALGKLERALDALAGKADTATTLAGYGITNAYTKTEVDTALSSKLGSSETAANSSKLGNVAASDYALKTDITTYSVFTGSGPSASSGLVPQPGATVGTTKFLREDGTWAEPAVDTSGSQVQLHVYD